MVDVPGFRIAAKRLIMRFGGRIGLTNRRIEYDVNIEIGQNDPVTRTEPPFPPVGIEPGRAPLRPRFPGPPCDGHVPP